VEADADFVFHTPFFRALSYLPEEGRVPARRVGHLLRALWKQARDDQVGDAMAALARLRLAAGPDLLEDVPEAFEDRAARHLLSQPWQYWRYPLGANRRRERRLYEGPLPKEAEPAADPDLQIKRPATDTAGGRGLP
jgi:hypothetical protein